jgi:hypothetical protein
VLSCNLDDEERYEGLCYIAIRPIGVYYVVVFVFVLSLLSLLLLAVLSSLFYSYDNYVLSPFLLVPLIVVIDGY